MVTWSLRPSKVPEATTSGWPSAWAGTAAEYDHDLDRLDAATTLFTATAREAAAMFPTNANVAMTTALAGVGPDRTQVTLVADPSATANRHEVVAEGAFGRLEIVIANEPLADNPRTSTLAALNLVRAIENRAATIVL